MDGPFAAGELGAFNNARVQEGERDTEHASETLVHIALEAVRKLKLLAVE